MRLALAALLALMAAPHALACSCLVAEPKSAFKSAAAVFLGEVVESGDGVARLRPLEWFKGKTNEVVELQNDIATCEYGGLRPGSACAGTPAGIHRDPLRLGWSEHQWFASSERRTPFESPEGSTERRFTNENIRQRQVVQRREGLRLHHQ